MKTPYAAALAKGWKLLAVMAKPNGETVVINEVGGWHPYACHVFNPADGGFYHGIYCKELDEAKAAFAKRMGWFNGVMNAPACAGCGG